MQQTPPFLTLRYLSGGQRDHRLAATARESHAGELEGHRLGQTEAVRESVGGSRVVLHPGPPAGRPEPRRVHADEHPRSRLPVAMNRDGFAIPSGQKLLHSLEASLKGRGQAARERAVALGRARPVSSAGCSTTASTRGAMNLAVRTTPPVRVSSRTSTVVRELRTSTVRPALVAPTMYSLAAPEPASTRTSTKSPFAMSVLCPNSGLLKRRQRMSQCPDHGRRWSGGVGRAGAAAAHAAEHLSRPIPRDAAGVAVERGPARGPGQGPPDPGQPRPGSGLRTGWPCRADLARCEVRGRARSGHTVAERASGAGHARAPRRRRAPPVRR